MVLAAEIPHEQYGSAIFVKPSITIVSAASKCHNSIEIITLDIGTCTVTSVYKPPKSPFEFHEPSNFDTRASKIVLGDFNSHSSVWGYRETNCDGLTVEAWAETNNLTLLHSPKLPPSFNSRRWNRGYNPDLIFTSDNLNTVSKKSVGLPIPNTQHRPIICQIHAAIRPQSVPFRRRFNFSKANWSQYAVNVDDLLLNLDPDPANYEEFVKIVQTMSRKFIPRGCRTSYIPGLNRDSSKLLSQYETLYNEDPFSASTLSTGEELMTAISEARKERWMRTVSGVDLTHNSKKAWSTIKKLTGDPPPPSTPGEVTANQVAHQLLMNSKPSLKIKHSKSSCLASKSNECFELAKSFTLNEAVLSIKSLKTGKATGYDDITVEQIQHLNPLSVSWLVAMFNACLKTSRIPKMWRRSKVVALLKPGKSPADPKSYRPISLLCHTYKLFERLLLNRLTSVIDPKLIPEQAGFRPGKSCSNQTLKLTQHIEDGFEGNMITGAVFVDLTAAYDTVNIRKLLCKVEHLTNDEAFVRILSELLRNRSFQVSLNSEKSRWRRQKNGLPQGSVLAPILFNIYTNDQPCPSNTHRFLYADDLALTTQAPTFEVAERTLTLALKEFSVYYNDNGLKPNPSKTQACAFHLRNRRAGRSLNIWWQQEKIEHCPYPKYLGITLDRSLTFKTHCLRTKQKVFSRNNLLRRLTTTKWGAKPHVLRTTATALCFSAGEYACPVWHNSAHAKQVDIALNDTCRIITGCLKPTPLNKLYPLTGIAPPDIRREVACCVEKRKQESDERHPLFDHDPPSARLKSRKSFLRSIQASSKSPAEERLTRWKTKHPAPPNFVSLQERLPSGHDLEWPTWKSLNRLRTQVGRCKQNMGRWGYIAASEDHCDCGAPIQSMDHLLQCPLCPNTCTLDDLNEANDAAIAVANYWADKI